MYTIIWIQYLHLLLCPLFYQFSCFIFLRFFIWIFWFASPVLYHLSEFTWFNIYGIRKPFACFYTAKETDTNKCHTRWRTPISFLQRLPIFNRVPSNFLTYSFFKFTQNCAPGGERENRGEPGEDLRPLAAPDRLPPHPLQPRALCTFKSAAVRAQRVVIWNGVPHPFHPLRGLAHLHHDGGPVSLGGTQFRVPAPALPGGTGPRQSISGQILFLKGWMFSLEG